MMVRDDASETPGKTGMRSPEVTEAYLKRYVEAAKGEPAPGCAKPAAKMVVATYRWLQQKHS